MKKRLGIFIAFVLIATMALTLVACSENTKQDPIATDIKGASVSDNGGMAVKYGNYIYFINGYAGETALNTFGDVVRGAICRVTLKEDGEPDYKTVKTIVPKNVYGEDKTYGGIYIVGDYIYYNTTSTDKNSKREYKSTEGVLTRTKIDGSVTETVKEFDDNDISLYAGDNSSYLLYAIDQKLYTLNAKNNEIKHITVSNAADQKLAGNSGYVAYKCFGDYAFYTMYNYADESKYSQDYFVYMCNLKTGKYTKIVDSDIYNGNTDRKILYKTTIISADIDGDKITLFYSKANNETTSKTTYCSIELNVENPVFDRTKEVTYKYSDENTAFYKLDNGYVLGFKAQNFEVFNSDGTKTEKADLSFDANTESKNLTFKFGSDITVVDLVENETEVYVTYIVDSTFTYCKLFNKVKEGNNTVYKPAKENVVKFSKVKYDSSYVTYDIIGNNIYYFNSDKANNAYYYRIPSFTESIDSSEIGNGKILGIISEEDLISLIAEEEKEEKEESAS